MTSRYYITSAPDPYEVVAGSQSCNHVGSQVVRYESPRASHTVWSCPRCHRIVRQDFTHPFGRKGTWTTPVAVVPEGQEGVLTPDGRQWRMPDRAQPLSLRKRIKWL